MSQLLGESLFQMNDFRTYVRIWVDSRRRGEFRKIADALKIHTTLVSQIFNGKKCFTEEQASKLCIYMSLNPLETDYFLKLVQIERAGCSELKVIYERHLAQIRERAAEIRSRVPEAEKLTERNRATFYSSWQYSFVRLLTSIPRRRSVQEISQYLGLPISRVQEILEFLTGLGLCAHKDGEYLRTEKNTHVEAQSPLAVRHHQNWRANSLELVEKATANDLVFTAPVSLSKNDLAAVRSILLETISDISKVVKISRSEEVAYLGIDWIKM